MNTSPSSSPASSMRLAIRSVRSSTRSMRIGVGIALSFVLGLVLSSCGSTKPSVCDPLTIEQSGRCFWSKEDACDAASCLPPSECVITNDKPSHVDCKKPAP